MATADDIVQEMLDRQGDLNAASEELADSLRMAARASGGSTSATDKQTTGAIKNASSFDQLDAAVQGSRDEQEAYMNIVTASGEVWDAMTGTVKMATKVLADMTTDLLGGEGFGMFKKMIDPIANVMESLGAVVGDLVGSMFKVFGDVGVIGGAMETVGSAAESAGEALGKVAAAAFKFVATIALESAEQLWNMFEGAASAGLLVNDGLHQMLINADALNLSTEEYTKLIQSQAKNLATFGGSVAAGAKQLTLVANASADHNRELRGLGISYQEQAEQTSEFMESMARTGQLRAMSDKDVADASFEYMKNLRVVSALTGKSAEDMKKDRDAALQNLAFQAKLAKMEPAVRTEMEAALGALPEGMQQAFKESVIFGKVMTDTGAIVSGSAEYIENFANSVANGTANFDDAFQTFRTDMKNAAPELRANLEGLAAAGMAELIGQGNAVTSSINESSAALLRVLSNVEAGTEFDVETAKSAGKRAGESVDNIIEMMDTQRELMLTILKEAEKRLPETSGILNSLTKGVAALFDKIQTAAEPGGALGTATDFVDGAMTTIKGIFETVKQVILDTMAAGLEAFQKVSKIIDDIVASETFQYFFGADIDPIEQSKKLSAAGDAAILNPSKENLEAVQEKQRGATVEQILKTEKDMATSGVSNRANLNVENMQKEIDSLRALINAEETGGPKQTTGEYIGMGFDTRNEQLDELIEEMKGMKAQQVTANANLEKLKQSVDLTQ